MRHNEVVQKLQSNFSTTKNLKESGIPWVGKIPKHWTLEKCKNFFTIRNVMVGDLWNQTRLLSLTLNGVIERDINNPEGKFPSDFSTYQLVKKNDLVFCLFDVEETPRAIGLATLEGMITGAYTVISVQKQDERFMAYFFINLDNYKRLSFLYRGLRKTISKEDFLNLKIPLPPLEEQKKIADFLDTKTRQIEEFITKKQKLITLLEEKKQTLINQCVTQGLDPSTPLKDSGVEWIGKIPTHWEVRKLKYVVSLRNQKEGASDFRIGLENIESKTGRFIQADESAFDDEGIGFFEGDVLFGKLRPYLAKVFLADKNGICVSEFLVLKSEGILNRFLKFLMLSGVFIEVVNSSTYGTKMPRANWEFIGNLKIPIPSLEEQKAIAEYLDTQIEKIDLAICKIKSQINLIKEYKTTLISEAVCGRVGID